MAAYTVQDDEVTEVDLASFQHPVIQNLGPGQLYVDWDSEVTTATGLKVSVNAVYEFPRTMPRGRSLYFIASAADTDVRVIGGAF